MDFRYEAVDAAGKRKRGQLAADNARAAVLQLRAQGLFATRVIPVVDDLAGTKAHAPVPRRPSSWSGVQEPLSPQRQPTRGAAGRRWLQLRETGSGRLRWSKPLLFRQSSRPQDVAVFSRQLATLLRAGITVAAGVQVLSAQAENPAFAKVLQAVWEEVQTGVQLSAALADRPKMFPNLLVQLLRAGEASGTLDEALDRAGRYYEQQHAVQQRVRTALAYPVLVMLVAVAACAVLLVKVVPVFSGILAAYHSQLPLPTRVVLAISRGLTEAWLPCLLLLLLAVAGWRYLLWRGSGVYFRDWLRLRMPVLRALVHKSVLASFSRTLAALVQSGLPLLQALELTARAVDNQVLVRALAPVLTGVADGRLLSELLSSVPVFPPLLVHMIRVGEESGHLDAMLDKAADFFEAEAETLADRFKALIEPFLILILAVVVGGIVLAVILPVFTIYQQMGQS